MFAVIFEVTPKPERREDYLRHAGLLRPELEKVTSVYSRLPEEILEAVERELGPLF